MKSIDVNEDRCCEEQAARRSISARNDFLAEKYQARKVFLQDISENPAYDFDTFGDPFPEAVWFTRDQIRSTTWTNVEGFLHASYEPEIYAIRTGCPPPRLTPTDKAKSFYFFVKEQKEKERRFMAQFHFALFADMDMFAYMPGPRNVAEARIIPLGHT